MIAHCLEASQPAQSLDLASAHSAWLHCRLQTSAHVYLPLQWTQASPSLGHHHMLDTASTEECRPADGPANDGHS